MATRFSGISKHHRIIRRNVGIWCALFFVAFLLLILRMAVLQLVRGSHYREIADRTHTRTIIIPHARGSVFDRNKKVLALDDERLSLYADPAWVKYPLTSEEESAVDVSLAFEEQNGASAFVARQLAAVIQRPEADIFSDLTHETPFVWIQRDVKPEVARAVKTLALPGIVVKMDGHRWRVGLDLTRVPHSDEFAPQVAEALSRPVKEVQAMVAPPETPGKAPTAEGTTPLPTGTRWFSGDFNGEQISAARHLLYAALVFQQGGINLSVGADPRLFRGKTPRANIKQVTAMLAPALGMEAGKIERRLLARPHFVWLKRDLTETMATAIQRMQGTIYVVQPGKTLESSAAKDEGKATERLEEAVTALYNIINDRKPGKNAPATPEVLSRDEIRKHLLPGAPPGPLFEKLDKHGPSLAIARRLFARPIAGVTYGLPGIGLQKERRRRYPYGTLAAQTLGFVGDVHEHLQGVFGVEMTQDHLLRGTDGRETKEIDARGMTIPEHSTRTEPVDGHDVTLTLNLDIQQAAEEEITKAVQANHALSGTCVVIDPKTGEILALAVAPGWDANDPGKSKVPLVNPIVSNFYEPGSTFKLVAVTGALEEGKIHPGQIIMNCCGPMVIGKHAIKEAHSYHGAVDCKRLLEQSCNLAAATLAMKLGPNLFLKWCDKFGFGKRTGIEVKSESPGYLNRNNAHRAQITLANMGFGQSLSITPLQLAAAYSAVANKGVWVQPHLVFQEGINKDHKKVILPAPRHRVCSQQTAALLMTYLENVVTHGTGKSSAIAGYRVAGKTGTAQKPVPGLGYHGHKFIGSFVGIMPVEDPRLTILAIIDEPKGSIYGGAIAAPVVREVGRRAMQYLNIPPNPPAATTAP